MAASSLPAVRSYDSPRSIACLVLFLCAAIVTVRPFTIPVPIPRFLPALLYHLRLRDTKDPLKSRTFHFLVNLNVGPVVAVLVLLVSECIGIVEFRAGIEGVGDLHPYDILLLFISLAYIAISLDATGALRFLAFWVAKKGGKSGWKLYFLLYLFFVILGGIVGNDPVILSGTAFLAYFTKACGIQSATAWIFAEFMAANLTSMVFVSSNPTNLIISAASRINFIYFSGWTILPAVLGSCTLFPILVIQFFPTQWAGNLVPRVLQPPELHPRAQLSDLRGAIFKSILLASTLATLIIANVFIIGLYVWWVTVPAALLVFIGDFLHDHGRPLQTHQNARRVENDELSSGVGERPSRTVASLKNHASERAPGVLAALDPGINRGVLRSGKRISQLPSYTSPSKRRRTFQSVVESLARRFPTIAGVAVRMPWALLPFAFSFFILVNALASSGWIAVWASWLSTIVHNSDTRAVFLIGFVCVLLCNISTNIGATLILTNVIYDNNFTSNNPSQRVQYGALFAIAVCSNIGAFSFVFPASLAGLLWRGILKQKGIEICGIDFVKYNLLPLVLTTTVALAVVLAEGCVATLK